MVYLVKSSSLIRSLLSLRPDTLGLPGGFSPISAVRSASSRVLSKWAFSSRLYFFMIMNLNGRETFQCQTHLLLFALPYRVAPVVIYSVGSGARIHADVPSRSVAE